MAQVRALALHVRADYDHRSINALPEPWWRACGITRNELDEVIRMAVDLGLVRIEVRVTNVGTHEPTVVPTDVVMEPAPRQWYESQLREMEARS
jgi:hypothetical protein